MSRGHPARGGGLLLFAMLLAALSALLISADLDGLRLRAQLSAMERARQLLLHETEQRLTAAERELAQIAPSQLPCRGRLCFTRRCDRGYCFRGEISAEGTAPFCRLHADAVPAHQDPQAWRNAASSPQTGAAGRRFLRLSEFRCFTADGIPLFRVSVRAEDGRQSLTLQSLYSARGRHGWRRLEQR